MSKARLASTWTRAITATDDHAVDCKEATAENPTGCRVCRRKAKLERRAAQAYVDAGHPLPVR